MGFSSPGACTPLFSCPKKWRACTARLFEIHALVFPPGMRRICRTSTAVDLLVAARQVKYCSRMTARKVVAAAAAYYVLFGTLAKQRHIRRRPGARSGARPRTRQNFDELQGSLSRAEFTRAFRMSPDTVSNLLSVLKHDLTRDAHWPRARVAAGSSLQLDLR
jgi:hypothetical protein